MDLDRQLLDIPLPPAHIGIWAHIIDDWEFFRMPQLFLCKLWASRLDYRDRCFIVANFFVNGVPRNLMDEVLTFANPHYFGLRRNKILDFWVYLTADGNLGFQRRERYYGYCMHEGRVVDCNLNPYVGVRAPWWNVRRPADICEELYGTRWRP